MRIGSALLLAAMVLVASPALAFASYGTSVDRTCTARGWVPARPFNPNNVNSTSPSKVNCGLCHARASNPNKQLTPDGQVYKASNRTDVSPFCSPPVATNRPPVFTAVGSQQASVGLLFQLAVAATDPDGDAIALSVSNAPAGATFADAGNGTGTFRWTPGQGQTGNRVVTFHATDAGAPMASSTLDVAISVGAAVNRAPTLAPVGDQQVDPGVQLAIAFSATDPDGDSVSYAVQPLPSGAALAGNAFTWTPTLAQVGSYPVTVTATDSGSPAASDSEAIVITVGRVNHPPVLAPIGNRTVDLGQSARIAISASDADGDALTLACSGLPSEATFTDLQDGTGEILWAPTVAGMSAATCSATDAAAPPGSDQESFTLTARDPAPPAGAPTLTAASWRAAGGMLELSGQVPAAAMPSSGKRPSVAFFAVLADDTRIALGTRSVAKNGAFNASLPTFIAPCRVAAAVAGVESAPRAVAGAPGSCDVALQLALRARSTCSGFGLRVKGRFAPPGGLVLGNDAETGERLFAATASSNGGVAAKVRVGAFVHALSIEVQSAGHSWTLATPVPVTNKCGR